MSLTYDEKLIIIGGIKGRGHLRFSLGETGVRSCG
jgi:hypothetical protein